MIRACCNVGRAALLCVAWTWWHTQLWAAAPPSLPRDTIRVGVMPFTGSALQDQTAYAVVNELLIGYGFEVQRLVRVDDPRAFLGPGAELDFVVSGVVDENAASALIYHSHSKPVRRLASTGPNSTRELAAKILRHVSSESSTREIVTKRMVQAAANLKVDPLDFDSLVLMGLSYFHQQDYPQAIQYFKEAIAVNPDDPDVHYNLAMSLGGPLGNRSRSTEKIVHLTAALALDPHHEAASLALANVHLETGHTAKAIAVYKQMLESPLNASLAHWNLAVTYNRQGELASALEHLRFIQPSERLYREAQEWISRLETALAAKAKQSVALRSQPELAEQEQLTNKSRSSSQPASSPSPSSTPQVKTPIHKPKIQANTAPGTTAAQATVPTLEPPAQRGFEFAWASRLLYSCGVLALAVVSWVALQKWMLRNPSRLVSPELVDLIPAPRGAAAITISSSDPTAEIAATTEIPWRPMRSIADVAELGLPLDPRESTEPILGRIGGYRLLVELGHGGMGTVYQALHPHLEKIVALKVLRSHLTSDPTAVARFRREMRAVGKLDHPNIVRATDAGEEGGTHFLVMDFVLGADLSRVIKQVGALPSPEACEIVRQAALALQHAHQHALVHRDIKPSNLMLTHEGSVKLLDLGLVRLQSDQPSGVDAVSHSLPLGTPDFMAPEQIDGDAPVDIRADIYSLGCTLYALLTGCAPYEDGRHLSPIAKIVAHLHEQSPDVRVLRPDLPEDLAGILDRMLAKAPQDRFSTPLEVAVALSSFAACGNLPMIVERVMSAQPELVDYAETTEFRR